MPEKPRTIDGGLDIYEIGLVEHRKGPNCVETSDDVPVCPGCGVGHLTVVDRG